MKVQFTAFVEDDDGTRHQYDLPEIEKVPECFRLLRMRTGLSQKAVADFIGVRKQAVQNWEAGQALPSMEHLVAVIHFLTKHRKTEPETAEAVKPKVSIRMPEGLKKPVDIHRKIDEIFGALQPLANE